MKRPIDTIVDLLAGKVKADPSGAKSLAHLLVVVPTAQSGRRLRQKLAERLGAVVPPLVKTPRGMMLDEDAPSLAGRTDELLAFVEALGGRMKTPDEDLKLARQLSDMRVVLSAKAISFADVAENLKVDMPDEAERWRDLADNETRYCAAMERGTLADQKVREALEKYTVIRLQAEDVMALRKLPGFEKVNGLPVFLVFE